MGEGEALTGAGGRAHAGEPAAAGGPEAKSDAKRRFWGMYSPPCGGLLIAY